MSECESIPIRYFQIEEEIFVNTPLKVKPSFFQKAVDLPNHKEWTDAITDEMDLMARNKV